MYFKLRKIIKQRVQRVEMDHNLRCESVKSNISVSSRGNVEEHAEDHGQY